MSNAWEHGEHHGNSTRVIISVPTAMIILTNHKNELDRSRFGVARAFAHGEHQAALREVNESRRVRHHLSRTQAIAAVTSSSSQNKTPFNLCVYLRDRRKNIF